jgi:hypothetical protein
LNRRLHQFYCFRQPWPSKQQQSKKNQVQGWQAQKLANGKEAFGRPFRNEHNFRSQRHLATRAARSLFLQAQTMIDSFIRRKKKNVFPGIPRKSALNFVGRQKGDDRFLGPL